MNLSVNINKPIVFLFFALIFNLFGNKEVSAQRKTNSSIATENLFTVNTVLNRFGMDFGYTRAVHSASPGGITGLLYSGTAGFIPNNRFQPKGQLTTKADVVAHAMIVIRLGAGLQYSTDFEKSYLYATPKIGVGLHYINVMFEGQFGLNKNGVALSKNLKDKGVVYINLNVPFDLNFFDFKYKSRQRE
ncbi:MAG: hypothetical protein EOP54_13050 [Sphingobacteriales bacterium]|nr:MAG: hypothetical protein EOP54_13050 [Sphingobacteriales bacterium]